MVEFIAEHFLEIIFGLISAGALAFCKYLHSQLKQNKILLQQQKDRLLEELIEEKIEPIRAEITKLQEKINAVEILEQRDIETILESYKFRLGQLCRIYLQQGYMYQYQWEQLSEMYKVYADLGGNGHGKEMYDKACALEIRPNPPSSGTVTTQQEKGQ